MCKGTFLFCYIFPSMFFFSPVRSLWPEVRPLLRSSLELMEKFQDKILEETEPFQSSVTLQPVSFQLDKDGQNFELSVRQKKQEDGKGSYSYRLQEFRQELDLPEGLTLKPSPAACLQTEAPHPGRQRGADREPSRGARRRTTAERELQKQDSKVQTPNTS
uniref:SHSP domain-containing protein n=1 Tax=Oryzias latipes TaxID=8090 RepID=A0A3B3I5L9_ORYLA